jgi:cell division protein FtsN
MSSVRGKQAVRGGGKPPLPAWVWLIAGFALGVGLSMFLILKDGMPTGPKPNPDAKPAAVEGEKPLVELAAGDSRGRDGDPKRPRYDFYSVLPEMETVIPDAELAVQSQRPPEPAPTNARLFLQVGSFGNSGDAEALKARLALVGVQAQVVPVNINGKSWHRVRVGPYTDARALEAAKRELASANYEAIALRETGR